MVAPTTRFASGTDAAPWDLRVAPGERRALQEIGQAGPAATRDIDMRTRSQHTPEFNPTTPPEVPVTPAPAPEIQPGTPTPEIPEPPPDPAEPDRPTGPEIQPDPAPPEYPGETPEPE
jgi:hypothetical protein